MPRKWPPKRRKDRRERARADKGTPEALDHFYALVGRKKRNNKDSAAENPVRLLHARGYLSDMQASALLGYTELHWHLINEIFGKQDCTTIAKDLVGNGSISMPSYIQDMRSEQKELEFKRQDEALRKCGRPVRELIRKITLDEMLDVNNLNINLPKFLVRQILCEWRGDEYHMTRVEKNEKAMMIVGADALLGR